MSAARAPQAAVWPSWLPPALAAALHGGWQADTWHQSARMRWHLWAPVGGPQPAAPAAVLLHGGSGSWTHWLRNIAALRQAGWQVLAPDLPGFGDSDLPAGCTDVPDLIEPLQAGLRQCQASGWAQGQRALVGFSFGGMAAALWLQAHPEAAQQLVLVGVPGLGLTVPERVPLKGWRHLPDVQAQEAVHRHNLLALMLHSPEALDALAMDLHRANVQRDRMPRRRLSGTPVLVPVLPALGVPVSAIFGAHDALYRHRLPEVQDWLARHLRRPAGFYTLPGVGHWAPYEAPGVFDSALAACLTGD